MLQIKSVQEEFLYKFTQEVISIKRKELDKKRLEALELARVKRRVEIEKLKEKFSKYGEQQQVQKVPEIIHQPPIQRIIEQPRPVKHEEMKPSITNKIVPPQKPIQKQVPQKKPVEQITIPIPSQLVLQPGELDLGKITFLLRDHLITYIECPGIDKNLIIRRAGTTTRTQITLKKEEILSIIKSFSEAARIPLIEGMLNARISNLEMSAVVSETTATSFILKKNPIPDMNKPLTQLQKPMMQIPTMPGVPNPIPQKTQVMPPISRPFTAPPMPQNKPQ